MLSKDTHEMVIQVLESEYHALSNAIERAEKSLEENSPHKIDLSLPREIERWKKIREKIINSIQEIENLSEMPTLSQTILETLDSTLYYFFEGMEQQIKIYRKNGKTVSDLENIERNILAAHGWVDQMKDKWRDETKNQQGDTSHSN